MNAAIRHLIQNKNICVLATIAGNKPYCSLMAYVTDNSCRDIYMVTHRQTTKYRNLIANPNVSLLIDSRETRPRSRAQALTVTGESQIISDDAELKAIRERLLAAHPHLESFMADPDAAIIRVTVKNLLFLDGLTDAQYVRL